MSINFVKNYKNRELLLLLSSYIHFIILLLSSLFFYILFYIIRLHITYIIITLRHMNKTHWHYLHYDIWYLFVVLKIDTQSIQGLNKIPHACTMSKFLSLKLSLNIKHIQTNLSRKFIQYHAVLMLVMMKIYMHPHINWILIFHYTS